MFLILTTTHQFTVIVVLFQSHDVRTEPETIYIIIYPFNLNQNL